MRSDAAASSWLHAHQQLGALALGTAPTNGQTVTLDINGTNVVLTAVGMIGSAAGNVLNPGNAAGFVANIITLLQNPTVTTSTGVALGVIGSANTVLVQYLNWALPSGGTTITPYSLNTSTAAPLTSFSASTTVTSGSWTAQTMKLYVQPGTYFIGGTRYLFTGGSTPTVTAPSSHPRIDVLTIDTSGTLAWTTGSENVSPVAPTYPVNKIPICELYNVTGETALYDNDYQQAGQGYIYNDVRTMVSNPYGQFILDPGSEAQGDILYYNGAGVWARLPAGSAGQVLTTQGASANPQWGTPFGTQLGQVTTQASVTANTGSFTTIQSLSSIPAVGANNSIRIRGHVNCQSAGSTVKLTIAGTDYQLATTGFGASVYFEIVLLNRGSQSTNDIYTAYCNNTNAQNISTNGFNASLGSAWSLQLKVSPGGNTTVICDYLDVYVVG